MATTSFACPASRDSIDLSCEYGLCSVVILRLWIVKFQSTILTGTVWFGFRHFLFFVSFSSRRRKYLDLTFTHVELDKFYVEISVFSCNLKLKNIFAICWLKLGRYFPLFETSRDISRNIFLMPHHVADVVCRDNLRTLTGCTVVDLIWLLHQWEIRNESLARDGRWDLSRISRMEWGRNWCHSFSQLFNPFQLIQLSWLRETPTFYSTIH